MGLFSGIGSFFGGVGAGAVTNTVKGIADVVDMFVETKDEKTAADHLRMKMLQEPGKWQIELNKIEAGHRTMFVAGWRPFIGWICGLGLGSHFIMFPFMEWGTALFGNKIAAPALDIGTLMTLVMAMLGLGSMRTYEKFKGKSN
jgi:hypothetical protein